MSTSSYEEPGALRETADATAGSSCADLWNLRAENGPEQRVMQSCTMINLSDIW